MPKLMDKDITFATTLPDLFRWQIDGYPKNIDVIAIEIVPSRIDKATGVGSLTSLAKLTFKYIGQDMSLPYPVRIGGLDIPAIFLVHSQYKKWVEEKLFPKLKEMSIKPEEDTAIWQYGYTPQGITTQEVDEVIKKLRKDGLEVHWWH